MKRKFFLVAFLLLGVIFHLAAQSFQWTKQGGGKEFDIPNNMITDAAGNSFVTGWFKDTTAIGSTTLISTGGQDFFLAKYDASGVMQWISYGGGSGGNDQGYGVGLDGAGNIYVAGSFQYAATFGTTAIVSNGAYDMFIAKYNSSGVLQWIQTGGGSIDDQANGIAVDINGNSYVTGNFANTATFGSSTITSSGSSDVFVGKYNSSGVLKWLKKVGGGANDNSWAIATDASGSAYITGIFRSTASFGSSIVTSSGSDDIFVTKCDTQGVFQWVKKAGGIDQEQANSITVDNAGNVYITGYFSSSCSFGTTVLTPSGLSDLFVAKYNAAGSLQSTMQAGGNGRTSAADITIDNAGNIYLCGSYEGTSSFGNYVISSLANGKDIFVCKANAAGNIQWVTQASGPSLYFDVAYGIGTDTSGNIYVSGTFQSTVSFGNTPLTSLGSGDIFITKLGECNFSGSILASADTICLSTGSSQLSLTTSGTSYQWTPTGGLNCYTCSNPVATPSVTSNYIALVNDGNGCLYSDTITIHVMVCAGIEQGENKQQLIIYPNPSDGEFYVINEFKGGNLLRIINVSGQVVYERNNLSSNLDSPVLIDLTHLPKGMYFLQMMAGDNNITASQKLVIH